jgi:hypothetical protein
MAKSIAMFVTIAAPPAVHVLLWWRLDRMQPLIWWALQALIFSVALGMLMDYRVAKSSNIEPSAYVEIRGLTTLVGWGGIVAAAAIAAIITLVQSTAALYVQSLLGIGSAGPTGLGGG